MTSRFVAGRRLRVVPALLMCVVLAASCSTGGGGTPDSGDGSSPAAEGTELRDELRIAVTSLGNENLDPIQALTDNNRYLRLMFDPLVGADYNSEEISKETGVAEDWVVSDDGLTYTFTIREGIEFHNGEALTADDVAFSLERYESDVAQTPNTSRISDLLDEITVVSPTEVQVTLTQPSFLFLTLLSGIVDPGGLIIPKDHFEEVGVEAFAQSPVGSGPYRFDDREGGSHITVERAFDEHWAIGAPRFERVTFRLVAEENARVSMLQANDVDFADVGLTGVGPLEDEGFQVFAHNGQAPIYVIFQIREDDPLADIELRRALSYAIDREGINEALLDGRGEATGNVWPGVAEPIPPTPYDPEEAESILEGTPYGPGGDPVNIVMQNPPGAGFPQMLQIAETVQANWRDIGIESEINHRELASFRTQWFDGELPAPTAVLMNFDPQVDWHSVVGTVWHCDGLFPNVCDPELDALFDEWGAASTMEEYLEGAAAHEQRMHDQYYVLPIVAAPLHYVGNDQVPSTYTPGDSVRDFNSRALVWNQ